MKLTFFFLLVFSMQISASISMHGQVTLKMQNESIRDVFREIETQSPYRFFYNEAFADLNKRVNINVDDKDINSTMDELLLMSDMAYKVLDNNLVVIAPKKELQQQEVAGRVTDAATGEPLPGVSVVIQGTTIGTTTNVDGQYSLANVPSDEYLVFTFVGMLTQVVAVNNRSVIDIIMEVDAIGIEELVVVGYGVQKRATMTGSISNVRGDEISHIPTTDASQMLTGMLPGVTSVQRSGEPGRDAAIIRIRGTNTLGDNSPLIVVDGVPGRSLSRIDQSSIQDITILKDASAAIYGSQAANGVILITTKRGTEGRPEFSLNLNQGYTQPTRIPKMANGSEYATLLNELNYYENRPPRYTDQEILAFTADDRDIWRYPNTDWFSEVLKPWSSQNNMNVQMTGGSQYLNYFLSAGSRFQDAYYRNSVSNYEQYDFRTNIDANLSEYISFGVDIYGRLEDTNTPTRGYGTIFRTTTLGNPNIHAIWPDGSPGPDIIEGSNPVTISTDAAGYDNSKIYALNSSFRTNIQVPWIEGLSFSASANLDKSFLNRKRWETPWEVSNWDGSTLGEDGLPVLSTGIVPFPDPRLTQYMHDNQMLMLNSILTYQNNWDNHNINIMTGAERTEGRGSNFNAYRRHFVSETIPELFAGGGANQNNSGSAFESGRLNYFGRVNYNFMEKYLVEFVWRYDGSYIFPAEKRYGFFPGVSLGWRLSEEPFWNDNITFINDFKLRASYGQTGNDRIGEWQYISSYGYRWQEYNFGIDQPNRMSYEARVPNVDITWEVADQMNFGFESYFLDSQLYFEFDYFDYRRSKILWWRDASVPTTAGISLPRENIGKVTNRGVDANIRYRSNQFSNFSYNISFNAGYAKNKITFWDETPGVPEWQESTGKPIPTIPTNLSHDLYYEAIGIFKDWDHVNSLPSWDGAQPGDIIFRDVNGDGVIDGNDRVRNEKNNIPKFTGGINVGMNYKRFDLSVLFQGAAGAVRYIATESGRIGNYTKDFYDNRWTPENPDASGPRAFNRDAEYWRSNRNTYWLRKSDYIRLRNLQFGYSLPETVIERLGIASLRIYASGYNLLTYTPDMVDFDPESDQRSLHGQSQPYPAQRVINLGISMNF